MDLGLHSFDNGVATHHIATADSRRSRRTARRKRLLSDDADTNESIPSTRPRLENDHPDKIDSNLATLMARIRG